MGRAIAVIGILGAFFAMLAAAIIIPNTMAGLAPGLFALIASIFLFLEKNQRAVILGSVTTILAFTAMIGNLGGSVSTANSEIKLLPEEYGAFVSVLACVAVALAVTLLYWNKITPSWMGIAAIGVAGTTVLAAFVGRELLTNQSNPFVWLVVILALATGAVPYRLIRA